MRKGLITALFFVMCRCVSAWTQDVRVITIDWDKIFSDTIVPYCSFQQPLEQDYLDNSYSCDIEYPEFFQLSKEQADRLKLNTVEIDDWPKVDSYVGVTSRLAALDVSFIPVVLRNGRYMGIRSFKAVIKAERVKRVPMLDIKQKERYTDKSLLSQGKWVKIRISSTGIYKLSDSFLHSAGFSDPSKVRLYGYGGRKLSEIDIHSLTDDIIQQPLWREEGYMLFYAVGPLTWAADYTNTYRQTVNTYSQYGYYFLTENDTVLPLSISMESPSGYSANNYLDTYADYALIDKDEFSWYRSGSRFFEGYDYQNHNTNRYSFLLDGITDDEVKMTVAFSASAGRSSTLSVKVNSVSAGIMTIPANGRYESASVVESTFLCRDLFSDNSVVELTHNENKGISGHLDFIRLNFRRSLSMRGSYTFFRTGKDALNTAFRISDSNQDVVVWRIQTDGAITQVPSMLSNDTTLTANSWCRTSDEFVAVNPKGAFSEPELVGTIANQNLHGLGNTDLVIIVPASGKLRAQAERLAQAHQVIDTMSVAVVSADQVYNEFSSGTPDATAYRRLMKMLYDRAGHGAEPRYLLLMGDGAWDNRMVTSEWRGSNPDDYLLCYESYNSTSHTESYVLEDYYGFLDDNEGGNPLYDKVDIGIGRLPVTSESSARILVDKIIAYMRGMHGGLWHNKVIMLGDDGDNNLHMKDIDEVACMVASRYPSLQVKKIYWDAYSMVVSASGNSYPDVHREILNCLEEGALLVNYAGHGSPEVFSHELVINKSDLSGLKSPHLPFWITASCDITPFDASISNLGESLMLNENGGGAIGMLSTTRSVSPNFNSSMNMLFTNYVLGRNDNGKRNTTGDALRLAKTALVTINSDYIDYSANKLHFVLIGDPALKLAVPEYSVVVDSFDNRSASSAELQAKAGSVIKVVGHIESDGQMVTNFNGKVYPTVFDNERTITTLNNTDQASERFSYKDRDRIIYSGVDSVRNGSFSFSVPVPLDINYSDESGKIYLYAEYGGNISANGNFADFIVGGTAHNFLNDSLGPELSMYLNQPEFIYGQKTNSTPLFVADIHDKDGLNTSGNGVGHDLLLVIDGKPEYTYVLNSYFEWVEGDYSRGRVTFSIPALPDGNHTLMFRCWDVYNNSTTRFLKFRVDSNLKPELSVQVTQNPTRTSTTFVVNHDRPGSETNIKIEVLDYNGNIHWTSSFVDNSDLGISLINWNLTGSNGVRLQPGVYMVRVTVRCAGSDNTVSNRLIVL